MENKKSNTDIADLTKFAGMTKLEVCKEIESKLSKDFTKKSNLVGRKIWNNYRKFVTYINSEGTTQPPPDTLLKKLANEVELKMTVKKVITRDYVLDEK